jgi:hypothetical protein
MEAEKWDRERIADTAENGFIQEATEITQRRGG